MGGGVNCSKNSFCVNLFNWGWLLDVFQFNQVPYLLELKKSPKVLFAGIDRPDDVLNFTHQELFAKGGFIVCDELALNTLTLGTDQVATQICMLFYWRWTDTLWHFHWTNSVKFIWRRHEESCWDSGGVRQAREMEMVSALQRQSQTSGKCKVSKSFPKRMFGPSRNDPLCVYTKATIS